MDLFCETGKKYDELLFTRKNFVFIGEAGSGKSEIVLNTALRLAEVSGKTVDVYDLDQSKPLFRSRDLSESFRRRGVNIHFQDQLLDAPTVAGGVQNALLSDEYTLLDIGGGHQAAKMAGPYSHILNSSDSLPVYIINPYRPWSGSTESIDVTMSHIVKSIRLEHLYLLGNPNLGCMTSADEVIAGIERTESVFRNITTVQTFCTRKEISEEVRNRTGRDIFPVELFLSESWNR